MKKIFIGVLLFVGLIQASVAFQNTRTYTQPDGTTFEGTVQGLAQIHWIETSTGDIIKYNFKKKAYYEIDFDEVKIYFIVCFLFKIILYNISS